MVHEQLRTGEWQDAHETIGPQRGGVVGTMDWRSGKYLGAAAVPQAFDERYFIFCIRPMPARRFYRSSLTS